HQFPRELQGLRVVLGVGESGEKPIGKGARRILLSDVRRRDLAEETAVVRLQIERGFLQFAEPFATALEQFAREATRQDQLRQVALRVEARELAPQRLDASLARERFRDRAEAEAPRPRRLARDRAVRPDLHDPSVAPVAAVEAVRLRRGGEKDAFALEALAVWEAHMGVA